MLGTCWVTSSACLSRSVELRCRVYDITTIIWCQRTNLFRLHIPFQVCSLHMVEKQRIIKESLWCINEDKTSSFKLLASWIKWEFLKEQFYESLSPSRSRQKLLFIHLAFIFCLTSWLSYPPLVSLVLDPKMKKKCSAFGNWPYK